jgi:hypothetical protein
MKEKSVWLHHPTGNPRKSLFLVSENQISLGGKAFATNDVVICKQKFPNRFFKTLNLLLFYALFLWLMYELLSLSIRLSVAINVEMTPGIDVARTNQRMQDLLELFNLRSSTTDDEQLALFLWVYLGTFLYQLFLANIVFRPSVYLELHNGETLQVPYLFVRPRKFIKVLGRIRKIAKKNRKALKLAAKE